MGVDVTTRPDENGVGAIADATGTGGKENRAILYLHFNILDKATPCSLHLEFSLYKLIV